MESNIFASDQSTSVPRRSVYLGVFILTLATLLHELLLTRIFSVTMWYHFAFVAISVAMFGLTVGAIVVYLRPAWFHVSKVHSQMARASLLFGITLILSVAAHAALPAMSRGQVNTWALILTYVCVTIPFIFSGIGVCLALTRFPGRIGSIYAVDLAGAAMGCLAFLFLLKLMDGPTAVVAVGFLACLAGYFFSRSCSGRRLKTVCLVSCVILGGFVAVHSPLVRMQKPWFRLESAKYGQEAKPIYEKWSSFARIRVDNAPLMPVKPFGWGMSRNFQTTRTIEELSLRIDGAAGTVLTKYTGQPEEIEHLKYDVTNFAHYLRSDADVLVVGTGGGRDVLAALAFDQQSVVGVELNGDILRTANKVFGDFTGHLDRLPNVKFVNDEARSYVASTSEKFDIIMVSLVDTWAATAAGAFVMTENSLYTLESWETFIEHLSERGILTFSRWYSGSSPGEMYRLTSLAAESLRNSGVADPSSHMMVIRQSVVSLGTDVPEGVGTLLLSRSPFTGDDIARARNVAADLGFEIVMDPESFVDPNIRTIATGEGLADLKAKLPYRINAPTDDSPFFFHMLRFRNVLDVASSEQGIMSFNVKAIMVLATLLATVLVLTLLCIIVPLLPTLKNLPRGATFPLSLFFASIGLGFMFVEISQMQRLIIFLGHPAYGLSVVLLSLLLASGLGSYLSERFSSFQSAGVLVVLLVVLAVFGVLTPAVIHAFESRVLWIRAAISIAVLVPIGIPMGMAFPIGMRRGLLLAPNLAPWLWGVNGAFSVCASVLSVVVALAAGISVSYWTGVACYGVALLTLMFSKIRVTVVAPERLWR